MCLEYFAQALRQRSQRHPWLLYVEYFPCWAGLRVERGAIFMLSATTTYIVPNVK